MGKVRSSRIKFKREMPSTYQSKDVEAVDPDRGKRSAATKARLAVAMAATKPYKAYKRHPVAARVMTFKDFRSPRKRERILKQFQRTQAVLGIKDRVGER